MAHMHHMRACVPCAPRVYPRCARTSGLRSVCPRCARLRARTVCTVCLCSLSSTCACSSPCLLRVPMLCVLELCAFVLDVWCCTGALVQRSPRSCGLRSPTSSTSRGCAGQCFVLALCMLALCALAPPMLPLRVPAVRAIAVHACVARACASHARVACTLITPAVRALAVRARAVCTFVLGVVPAFPTCLTLDLPFPLHGTSPGAPSIPSHLILCMPILSYMP